MSDSEAASARSEPSVPELDASRFELLEAIGSGGMGTVYRALQRSVGRYVAVKMLAPEHAANVSGLVRFVREANAIARLTHPNIVQLIDFGRDAQGRMLLVMELLEGESLRALLRREKPLNIERATWVAVQCLNALRTAHAAGVIHRDLKPENIFIHHTDGEDHVKVLDFGVAKLTQADVGEHTTQGSLVGTLRYMAPEQIAGDPPDPRIDVYSMGVLLYEMLTGTVPYDTRDRYVLLRQIIAEEPRDIRAHAPELPTELAAVVMHALVKDPRERYASAEEFRRVLLPFVPSEAARSQVLSDAGVRAPTAPSQIVSADVHSGAYRVTQGARPAEGAVHSERFAISAPTPGAWPATAPTEHIASVHARPRRPPWLLPVIVGSALFLTIAGGGAGYVFTLHAPPAAPPRAGAGPSAHTPSLPQPSPHGASPAAIVPPLHPLAVRPVPAPVPTVPAPPTLQRPTRIVLVTTAPSGARVLDASGQALCPATPCAIPVAIGQQRAVQVVLGGNTVSAVLDGSQSPVHLDLAELAPPVPPQRPHTPRTRHGDDGLPMFLPGGH